MTTPQKSLPLRVLVKGPSTLIWTSMMSGPRSDITFPRAMERELLAKGRPAEVWNAGVNGWVTKHLFDTWDEEVASWSPDILILAPAHMETIHAILPRWLERGANNVNRRPGLFTRIFYRKILRLASRTMLKIQRKIDRPGFAGKYKLRRPLADAEAYIKMTSQVASPLILLLEVHPPTQAKLAWFPGWMHRIDEVNKALRAMADRYENVRFFEIRDLMEKFDPGTPEALWADGIHFRNDVHQAIGEKLAETAEEWAATQPHLAPL